MSGYLIYKNNILDASIGITVSTGTITDVTDKNKLLNRNLEDPYTFTPSATGIMYITVTAPSAVFYSSMSLMSFNSINSFTGKIDTVSMTFDYVVTNTRLIDGELRYDTIICASSLATGTVFEFAITVSGGVTYKIGSILVAQSIPLDFKPENADYGGVDTGEKDRSNGGQVYSKEGNFYETVKVKTSIITNALARDANGSVMDINRTAKTTEPIIFVPYDGDNVSLYGTQKTLAKLKPAPKKDSNDWYWTATFDIEEEL